MEIMTQDVLKRISVKSQQFFLRVGTLQTLQHSLNGSQESRQRVWEGKSYDWIPESAARKLRERESNRSGEGAGDLDRFTVPAMIRGTSGLIQP